MTKQFSFAAVMSVVTRRHLAKEVQEEYDLIGFLTGKTVHVGDSESLVRLYEAAQSQLFQQFERLGDGHMQFAQGELVQFLETVVDKDKPNLILGWLSKQSTRLGMDFNKPVTIREPSTR